MGNEASREHGGDGGNDRGGAARLRAHVNAPCVSHGAEVGDDAQEVELGAHGHALRFCEGHAYEPVYETQEVLAGEAGCAGLSDTVVVEVVGDHNAAAPAEEGDYELGQAVELVDRRGEPEVHAREEEEPRESGGGVHKAHYRVLRGARRAAPVGHLDVLGAALHGPAGGAEVLGEKCCGPSREIGRVAGDGLTEGGALVVEAGGRVVAATQLDSAVLPQLGNGEGEHGAPLAAAEA